MRNIIGDLRSFYSDFIWITEGHLSGYEKDGRFFQEYIVLWGQKGK